MSMTVNLECRPTNLNEAEVANEIAAAVKAVVEKHGGHSEGVEHVHNVRRFPDNPNADHWYDAGMMVRLYAGCHKDGAPIPLLKQAEADA